MNERPHSTTKTTTGTTGALGESYAARCLNERGYTILASNFRTRFGEVDIIAADGTYLCFVEVKTRGETMLVRPMEAVTFTKQRRICLAAAEYLSRHDLDLQPRFDVLEIYLDAAGDLLKSNLIENAFESVI